MHAATTGAVEDYLAREGNPPRWLSAVVMRKASELGLVAEVERAEIMFVSANSVDPLIRIFKASQIYLGYELYYEPRMGNVLPVVDLARFCAQIQYPKKVFKKEEVCQDEMYCAIRCTTLLANVGFSYCGEFNDRLVRVRCNVLEFVDLVISKYGEVTNRELGNENYYEHSEIAPYGLRSVAACKRYLGATVEEFAENHMALWGGFPESTIVPENPPIFKAVPSDEKVPASVRPRALALKRGLPDPIRSWRSVGREPPVAAEVREAIQNLSELSTARGRRGEHQRAGEEYLQSIQEILDDDEQGELPARAKRGKRKAKN